jgi:AbrB family looped-hinge helix DNA binding protein
MPNKLSVVQEKGQVTIPTEIRKKLGLKKGDYVAFVETEHGVIIAPREVIAMDALDKIGAALKEQGITLETLMERSHAMRGEILNEHDGCAEE